MNGSTQRPRGGKGAATAAVKATGNPVVKALTRLGYGSRGLIYGTMGLLAIKVATGSGRTSADQQGAIAAIGRQPAGRILLVAVLAGLVCYALWGVFRAVFDRYREGHGVKGLLARLGYLCSAIAYGLLVIPTWRLVAGGAHPATGGAQAAQTRDSVASLLARPSGAWLVGAVGVVVVAVGVYQVGQGLRGKLDRLIATSRLRARRLKWITGLGRFGITARGVVFVLVGALIAMAAYRSDPGQPQGIDQALLTLLREPFGPALVGLVAIGLLAFGVYSLVTALWLRFDA